jgi:DNA-binding NarL/FixJ family response regulator
MSERSVLFISADGAAAARVEAVLREGFRESLTLMRVDALFDGLRYLQERSFSLIMSDLFLPDGQGLATLRHLQQHAPNTPMIALCHAQDRDTAVTAVRKGAYDFFCYEDIDADHLRRSMESAMNHAAEDTAVRKASERRNHARFPCRLAVSYQTLEQPIFSGQGSSETLNISSKGLLFTSQEKFIPGQLLQVSLDWPARLENQIPLKLVAEGRIVRNENGQAAMTIDKYEFRTRRAANKGAPGTAAEPARPAQNRAQDAAFSSISQPGTAAGGSIRGAERRMV